MGISRYEERPARLPLESRSAADEEEAGWPVSSHPPRQRTKSVERIKVLLLLLALLLPRKNGALEGEREPGDAAKKTVENRVSGEYNGAVPQGIDETGRLTKGRTPTVGLGKTP